MHRLLLLVMLALVGCAQDGVTASDAGDCIAKYASTAASPLGVTGGASMCRRLFSETSTEAEKRVARCVLSKLPGTKNDQGVRAVYYGCQKGQ